MPNRMFDKPLLQGSCSRSADDPQWQKWFLTLYLDKDYRLRHVMG